MASRLGVAVLTVALGFGAISHVIAAPVEEEFAQVCLGSSTSTAATARARDAGYVKAPADIARRMEDLAPDGQVLWRADEGEMLLFIAASVKRDLPSSTQAMTGELCAVASMPQQPDLKVRTRQLLNVGDDQPMGRSTAFIFEETADGRVRLDASDKALMAVKTVQGAARIVGVLDRSGMSGLMLMIPVIGAK